MKGCESYLTYVFDNHVESLMLDSVPFVCKFLDIPFDMPGIPSDCEIEFAIDLEAGTQPISIEPYCMAPIDIKELNSQLQFLLAKASLD